MPKRIGILLSGGASSGMNKVIYDITCYAESKSYELIGFIHGWLGLMENDFRVLTSKSVRYVETEGGGILGSCKNVNVFDYFGEDKSQICLKNYQELQLECIFVAGGDGSIRQANELSKTGIKFICIPTTINNDIVGTDMTVGFSTAVFEFTKDINSMITYGKTMGENVIIETMGEHSGKIAVHATSEACLQQNYVDVLLIPEVSYDMEKLTKHIFTIKKPIFIVISGGIEVKSLQKEQGFSKAELLARAIELTTAKSFTVTQVGYNQRSGCTALEDQFFALEFCKMAIKSFEKGVTNVVTVYSNGDYHLKSIEEIAKTNSEVGSTKKIDSETEIFIKRLINTIYFGN